MDKDTDPRTERRASLKECRAEGDLTLLHQWFPNLFFLPAPTSISHPDQHIPNSTPLGGKKNEGRFFIKATCLNQTQTTRTQTRHSRIWIKPKWNEVSMWCNRERKSKQQQQDDILYLVRPLEAAHLGNHCTTLTWTDDDQTKMYSFYTQTDSLLSP